MVGMGRITITEIGVARGGLWDTWDSVGMNSEGRGIFVKSCINGGSRGNVVQRPKGLGNNLLAGRTGFVPLLSQWPVN